jgi:hypothetical protein
MVVLLHPNEQKRSPGTPIRTMPTSQNRDVGHPALGYVRSKDRFVTHYLVGVGHGVVELLEEGFVFFFAGLFGVAEGVDALDADLGGRGLSF